MARYGNQLAQLSPYILGADDDDETDDDDTDLAQLVQLAVSGDLDLGGVEIGGVEIGRVARRLPRNRKRQAANLMALAQQNAALRAQLTATARGMGTIRQSTPNEVRVGPWGNMATAAAAGALTISVTAQDPFTMEKVIISGVDTSVPPVAVTPERIVVTDIKVGTQSAMPVVGLMTANMFQGNSVTPLFRQRTIQAGMTLSCILTVPVAGTYAFMGTSELAR